MSNEIKISCSIEVNNGSFVFPRILTSMQIDQANIGGGGPGFQNVGTSAETIPQTDLTATGYVYARNLDGTNYVEIGLDSSGFIPLIKLRAGEVCLFPLSAGVTLQARANTSACKMQIHIFNA